MGQRANYAIIENGAYRLYYSHWAANTIDRDLFWGPEYSLTFIRRQQEIRPNDWLDDVWCEGGAVVDLDSRRITIFGGEDIKYEIPLRRLYLRLLTKSWHGWTVTWAHEGIADLANAAKYPRANVFSKQPTKSSEWPPLRAPSDEETWGYCVMSVQQASGLIQLFPLVLFTEDRLFEGPNLVGKLLSMPPLEELSLDKKVGLPTIGVHSDLSTKSLEFWTATPQPGIVQDMQVAWPGWRILWHYDKFEFQEDRLQGRLRYPRFTDSELLPRIAEIVLRDLDSEGPVKRFESMMAILEKEGQKITEVNKMTAIHTDWCPSRQDRERVWAGILSALRLE